MWSSGNSLFIAIIAQVYDGGQLAVGSDMTVLLVFTASTGRRRHSAAAIVLNGVRGAHW